MGQDFIHRIPLITKQGNFGSIENPKSFAALRYCVTGKSLISFSNGSLKRIDSLISDKKEEIALKEPVLNYNREEVLTSKVFNCGFHKIIKIETLYGLKLECSYNHPILVLSFTEEYDFPILEWKLAEDLELNDIIVCTLGNYPDKDFEYTDYLKAVMLGAMTAEGYISSDKQNYYRVGFSNIEQDYTDLVEKGLREDLDNNNLSDIEIHVLPGTGTNFPLTELNIYSPVYRKLIQKRIGKSSKVRKIPEEILSSTDHREKAAFLASLFQGDGYICTCNDKRGHLSNIHLALSSYSETLIQETQIILQEFGILSRKGPDREGYNLTVSGISNIIKFSNKIGFLLPSKQKILEDLIKNNQDIKRRSKLEEIPYLKEAIRAKAKTKKQHWKLVHTALVTKENIENSLDFI